jgi:hypothetical protein
MRRIVHLHRLTSVVVFIVNTIINPAADLPLPGGTAELIMVGTTDAQREFIEKYFRGDGVNARARQA